MATQTYQYAAKLAEADGRHDVAAQLRAMAASQGLGGLGAYGYYCWPSDDYFLDTTREAGAGAYYMSKYHTVLPQRVRDAMIAFHPCTQADMAAVLDSLPPVAGDVPAINNSTSTNLNPNLNTNTTTPSTMPDILPIAGAAGAALLLLLLLSKKKSSAS